MIDIFNPTVWISLRAEKKWRIFVIFILKCPLSPLSQEVRIRDVICTGRATDPESGISIQCLKI